MGEPSPNLFLLISGNVLATTSKKEWGPDVTMNVKMFKDGDTFGEVSEYSPSELRELIDLKASAHVNTEPSEKDCVIHFKPKVSLKKHIKKMEKKN